MSAMSVRTRSKRLWTSAEMLPGAIGGRADGAQGHGPARAGGTDVQAAAPERRRRLLRARISAFDNNIDNDLKLLKLVKEHP